MNARDSKSGGGWIVPGIAGIVVVAGVAAAIYMVGGQGSPVPGFEAVGEEPLHPELQRGDIAAVRIIGADQQVNLAREGDGWTVGERGGYPADGAAVNELLGAVSELTAYFVSEGSPGPLETDSPLRVELRDSGGDRVAWIAVGAIRSAPGGETITKTLVHRREDGRAWLVDRELAFGADPVEWIDRRLVDIPPEDVVGVRLEPKVGEPLVIRRGDPDSPLVPVAGGFPEEGTERNLMITTMSAALQRVEIQDVRPAGEAGPLEPADPVRAQYETRSGLMLSLDLARRDGEGALWVSLSADAANGAAADVRAEAQRLDRRHGDWIYQVFELFTPEALANGNAGGPAAAPAGPASGE